MATLPGPLDVGPLPDATPRMGRVGRWNPSVISSAADAAGRGLENLGTGIVDVAAQQQDQANQLEVAQARGTATAAEISGHSALPSITDPNQLPAIQQGFTDARDAALSRITNPRLRAMTAAEMLPQEARLGAAVTARGNAINNDQQIATYEQNTNTTIGTGATLDNDEVSQHSLDSVNQNIDGLVKGGSITAVQGQLYRQRAVKDYISARERYLEDIARRTGDTTRLEQFAAANAMPGAAPSSGIANTDLPPEAQAFLSTLYGPESAGKYNVRYTPSGGTPFSGYGDHPRIPEKILTGPNAGQTSDAAGAPQFLGSTWDTEKKELGLTDFSPRNQDAGAWHLAQKTYAKATGGDLLTALRSGDPEKIAGVASALKSVWPSLPGGSQQGTTANSFLSRFNANLEGSRPTSPATPFSAIPQAPRPDASNSYFIGDSIAEGLKGAAKAPGDTAVGRSPEHVLDAINDADPSDLQGKTIYLSSGASNAPDATTMVHAQLYALKEKGVDIANVRVVGVGDRKDFVESKVNDQLAAIAKVDGAVFTGPLDNSNLAGDRVHAADYGKALTQVAGLNDMNAGGAKAAPHVGDENFDAANAALNLTPQEQAFYQRHLTNLNGSGGVDNKNGSRSTLLQTSIEADGKFYNIPTVWDGKILPAQEAIARAKAEGLDKFPSYATEEEAETRYQQMHSFMEKDTGALLAQRRLAQGIDPSRYPIVPAKSEWPVGTSHVALKQDGTFDYVADDGTRTPVPGLRPTGTPDAGLPDHPTGSIIDHLPPQDRAEMVLHVHNVIDQIQRARQAQSNLQDKRTLEDINFWSGQAATGQPVPPAISDDLRNRAIASSNPDTTAAFARFDAGLNTVQRLDGLSPDQVGYAVNNMRADYTRSLQADPFGSATQLKWAALQAAEGYQKKFDADIKSQPLTRASMDNTLPAGTVKPLDAASPTIAQDFRQRAAAIKVVSDRYGVPVPLFTGGEGAAFAQSLAKTPASLSSFASPDLIAQMADDNGFKQSIVGMSRSADPTKMNAAFNAMNAISVADPMKFDGRFGKEDTTNMELWQRLLSNMPSELAAKRMEAVTDPNFAATRKYRDEAANEALKIVTAPDVVKRFSQFSYLNPITWPSGAKGAPVSDIDTPSAAAGALRADWTSAFKDYFVLDPNKDQAAQAADAAVSKKWGASPANGNRLMPYPPESRYPAVNGKWDYIRDQLDEAVRAHVGDMGNVELGEGGEELTQKTPEQISATANYNAPRALVADTQTKADIDAGKLPSYKVVVQDGTGQFHLLKRSPGVAMRFFADPSVPQTKAESEFTAARAARATDLAARHAVEVAPFPSVRAPTPTPIPSTTGEGPRIP